VNTILFDSIFAQVDNSMKNILKGSALVFAFKVVGAASLFAVHLIIGREYGAESLGVFSLVFALMVITSVGAKVGLDVYVVRVLPEIDHSPDLIGGFLARIAWVIFVGSLIVSSILFLLLPAIDLYVFKSVDAASYLMWLAPLMLPLAVFNVVPEIFRGLGDVKRYSFFRNIAQNIFLLFVLGVSVFVLGNSVDPVSALYSVTLFVAVWVSIELWLFLRRRGVGSFHPSRYSKAIVSHSYPMMLTSSMMVLMGYVDSFMLSYYMDETHVGIYNACIKLSIALTFVLASINGYIAPSISRAYSGGRLDQVKRIYRDSVKIVVVTVIPVAGVFYLFPGFFLGLFGEEFVSAENIFFIITTAFLVSAVFGPIGYLMNMTDNQGYVMRVVFISLIVNVVLNVLLIPLYGLLGAAVALLVSQIGWNTLLFIKGKRLGLT
jgi:O-antigen/teichoic acid export membrane protein